MPTTSASPETEKKPSSKETFTPSAVGIIYDPQQRVPPTKAPTAVFSIFVAPKQGEDQDALNVTNISLEQGFNVVSKQQADQLEEVEPKLFKRGALERIDNIGELSGSGKNKELKNLLKLSASDAVRVVALEKDRDALKRWLNEESRNAVAGAINNQISKLQNATEQGDFI